MLDVFAFFGTGPCDPNKDLKQFLAVAGTIAGWIILILLIRKLNKSNQSKVVKISLSVLIILAGLIGSAVIFLVTLIGLACSSYR